MKELPRNQQCCPGSQNPADLPTCGMSANELLKSELWHHGPQYLQLPPDQWPTIDCPDNASANEELVKRPQEITHALQLKLEMPYSKTEENIFKFKRFGRKTRLLRAVAWVCRFIFKLKQSVKKLKLNEGILTTEELEKSEKVITRVVQSEAFAAELKYLTEKSGTTKPTNYIKEFNLFLDEDHLLRCKTKLRHAEIPEDNKNPIILPSRHQFSWLIIQEAHEKVYHSGIGLTLSTVRKRFWILRGRESVKRVLCDCITCKRLQGKPFKPATATELPEFRVDQGLSFVNTNLDFAGPLMVKLGDQLQKAYVCLYTCPASRAVHLELTGGLDVLSFLRCFRKFSARRGLPKVLISDNAQTFHCADKDIRKIARSEAVRTNLANKGVNWKFIISRSPNYGRYWERLIRTVKNNLKKVIGRAYLTYDELFTCIVEIESIVNARPLCYLYDDGEGASYALTPSHLIYGRNVSMLPSDRHFEIVHMNL